MNKNITRKIYFITIAILLTISMSFNIVKAEELDNLDNTEIKTNLDENENQEEDLTIEKKAEEEEETEEEEEPIEVEQTEKPLEDITVELVEETPNNLEETEEVVEEEKQEEIEENVGIVNVYYVDQEGDRIAKDEVYSNQIDTVYNTFKKDIENYSLVDIHGNTSGLYTEETIDVYYIYALNEKEVEPVIELGTVKVEYVTTSGEELTEKVELTDEIGKTYYTEELTFPNFYHAQTKGEEVGTYTKEEKRVTYVYDNTTVIKIRYVDNNENELLDSIYMIGKIGNEYNTSAKEIDGYVLTKEPNNKTGIFTEETQIITYMYEKEGIGKTNTYQEVKLSKKIPPKTSIDSTNYHTLALLLILVLLGIKLKYKISG